MKVLVEAVIDVVCPWCCLGVGVLKEAMAVMEEKEGMEFEVKFLPWVLGKKTIEKREMYKKRMGETRMAAMETELTKQFAKLGMGFTLDGVFGSSRDAHILAAHAPDPDAFYTDLFKKYFEEGCDIALHTTLVPLALSHNIGSPEALLSEPAQAARLDSLLSASHELLSPFASGVPFFFFTERSTGVKQAIPGAQDLDIFLNTLRRLKHKSLNAKI